MSGAACDDAFSLVFDWRGFAKTPIGGKYRRHVFCTEYFGREHG
jgi:hypothetical protein